MKLGELFAEVDELKPSQFDDSVKVKWLNEVEGRIIKEVIAAREEDASMEGYAFNGYTNETPIDTELVVKEPYAALYRYYLFSMIDLGNEEYDRYQNSAALFNQAYADFANYWYRTHKTAGVKRFIH